MWCRHRGEDESEDWPIWLTMSLSFILDPSQTTSFKMTSFFSLPVPGSRGSVQGSQASAEQWPVICTKMCEMPRQAAGAVEGPGPLIGHILSDLFSDWPRPVWPSSRGCVVESMTSDDEKNCKHWPRDLTSLWRLDTGHEKSVSLAFLCHDFVTPRDGDCDGLSALSPVCVEAIPNL